MFIIALSKDQIVVWLATFKHDHSEQIFLLATPYGRMKDYSKRLESLYGKKVRGNRLEHLDANGLDSMNAPFVSEYTNSVFRISDLAGFGAAFPLKANFAQTQAFTLAANFLKEKFANCQFMIRYDAKSFRSSTINNWLKKNTLNAKLDPLELETSLELQTASLFAALLIDDHSERFNDPQIQEIIKKLNANIALSPKWQSVDRAALYLELFKPQWKDLLKAIFTKAPQLLDEGLGEKWLKKQIDEEYLKTVIKCLELEDGVDLVLSSSINRLASEYEKHLEMLQQERHKYDLDEFKNWADLYDQAAKTQIHESIDLGSEYWQKAIEQEMAKWIENPNQCCQAKTIYLVAQDEKVAFFTFSSPNYSKQLFEQVLAFEPSEQLNSKQELLIQRLKDSFVFETGYLKNLDEVIAQLSAQTVISNLYCSTSMYHLVMKIELLQNRFVPCYPMDHQQRTWIHQLKDMLYSDCFENMTSAKEESITQENVVENEQSLEETAQANAELIQDDEETLNESQEVEVSVWPQPKKKWFKTEIYQKMKDEDLKRLAKSNLSFAQIRLIGQALARGLQPKLFATLLRHPEWIEEIIMPYLFNSRKQKWFDQQKEIEGKPIRSLYFNPKWSVSKLDAIAKLVQDGLDEQWLKTNLRSNMSLGQIEQLATIYPYGKLPRQYAIVMQIPTSVEDWLIKQASQQHPELTKDELDLRLAIWNEHLFQEVFENVSHVNQ